MTNKQPHYAWLNGQIVRWEDCVLHARTQGAFWGANVFEGIRAYWLEDEQQLQIYRIGDHISRLRESMKCVDMPITYTDKTIIDACVELLRNNEFQEDVHIVITAYFGMGPNFDPLNYTEDTGMHITAIPMPRSPRYGTGATATISSWRRISDDTMPPRIKTGANYHNSRLAQHEAVRNGYDTAFLLNQKATISEAPGSCIAMYNNNTLTTPPGSSGVLEGITVDSVAELAEKQLNLTFERREIDRTELYLADEVFICGTLAEIQPIISLDRKLIGNGKPGEMTRKLQALYELEVRDGSNAEIMIPVYQKI
jgi:branched-chain amino acid aminotransferase